MPARGPEPISARSPAIFVSETATHLQRARELDERVAVRLRLERVERRRDLLQAGFAASAARAPSRRSAGACSGRCPSRCRRAGSARRARAPPRRAPCRARSARRSRRTPVRASRARRPSGACGPDLTTFWKLCALRANERSSCLSAGSSSFWATSSAARWTAEGNTSLEDWPMLTWSLGCTPAPARCAMTSLAFMFVEVPEPVWKTSIGNCASCLPAAISAAAFSIRAGAALGEQAQLAVDDGRRALDARQPVDDRDGHRLAGDREVLDGLGGLAAPQLLIGLAFALLFERTMADGAPAATRAWRPAGRGAEPYPQNAASSRASPTGSS